MASPLATPGATLRRPSTGYEEDEYYKTLPDQIGGPTGIPQIGQIAGLDGTSAPGVSLWGDPQQMRGGSTSDAQRSADGGGSGQNLGRPQTGTSPQTTNLIAEAARLTGNPPPEEQRPPGVFAQAPHISAGRTDIESPVGMQTGGTVQPHALPAASGQFAAVDPGGVYTPEDALALLEQRAGRALSPEERTAAIQASGWNQSGSLTGAHINSILQWGAGAMGGQFTPWGGSGGQPPPPTRPPSPTGTYTPEDAEARARERFRGRFNRDLTPQEWTTLLARVPGFQPGQPISQAQLDEAFRLIDEYGGTLPGGGGGGGPVAPPPRAPVPPPSAPTGGPRVPYEPYTPTPRTPIPPAAPYQAPTTPWGPALTSNVTPAPEFRAPEYRPPPAYRAPDPFSYEDYTAPAPFQYDPYQAPAAFQYADYQAPENFAFREHEARPEFVAPTWDEIQNDPGYQFRLRAGTQAREQSAAAGGVLRTGGTLKGLEDYAQGLASQEYGNVYNRRASEWDRANAANTEDYTLDRDTARGTWDRNTALGQSAYDRNRAGAESAWDRNTGLGERAYERNRAGAERAYDVNAAAGRYAHETNRAGAERDYDRNTATGRYAYETAADRADREYAAAFQGAQAEYDPRFAGWQARTAADQRTGELNFDRQHQQALYDRDDAWRQYAFQTGMEQDRLRYNNQADWEREVFGRQQEVDRARYLGDDAYRRERDANDLELQRAIRGSDEAWREFVNAQENAWRREELEESRRRFLIEVGMR
jgi:hypothetical protein